MIKISMILGKGKRNSRGRGELGRGGGGRRK